MVPVVTAVLLTWKPGSFHPGTGNRLGDIFSFLVLYNKVALASVFTVPFQTSNVRRNTVVKKSICVRVSFFQQTALQQLTV